MAAEETLYAPNVRVELVRDGDSKIPVQKIESPETAAEIMRLHLGRVADEHAVVILVDTRSMLIGALTVHVGAIDESLARTRNVLRPAIIHNAMGVIFGHNHPSGKAEPSLEDLGFFKKLKRAADDQDIRLLDCIIIGDGTKELYSHRRNTFDL